MQGRNAQVARIYRILTLLEGAPQGLTAAELHERLSERDHEVSRRTVYRDLQALSDAGFPLAENDARWVLERGTRINQYLALSARELLALHLARGLLPWAELESVFRKIKDKLGTAHREYFGELSSEVRFESNAAAGPALDHELLETVRAACAEGQVLAVDYDSVSSRTRSRRRLGPHYVYFARSAAYLIAEDLANGQTKVFALSRMRNAVMEEAAYDGKPVDHEAFFAASFGVFRGLKPSLVRLRFSQVVSPIVRERRWHASQALTEHEDGALELTMTVALTPELVQWILGFGAEAQVLAPDELRAEIATAVSAMAKLYA